MLPENIAIKLIKKIMNGSPVEYPSIIKILNDKELLVKTDDGTVTLRSESESELMHSQIGAMTEAFEKFTIPSDVKNIKDPHILDLCSGLGYNTLSALVHNQNATIDMLEISREMIFLGKYIEMPYKEKILLNQAISDYFQNIQSTRIHIFCDDARKLLLNFREKNYDIVFHDGFSPAKDPALYTVDFLKLVYNLMNPNSILLSYSSSIPFRSALIEAGFYIGEGPSVGRNRGLTIAVINKYDYRLTNRIPLDDEKLIALSTIGIPFTDQYLNGSSEQMNIIRENKRNDAKMKDNYISTKKIKKNLIDQIYDKIQQESMDSRESILKMKEYYKNQ